MFAIDIHLYINILLLNHKVLIESKESRSGEDRERERERGRLEVFVLSLFQIVQTSFR